MRWLPLVLLTACSHQVVPIKHCSEDFRDKWWHLDPEVTDSMGANAEVCFRFRSNGNLRLIDDHGWDYGPYEWECADTNHFRVKRQGYLTAKKRDEEKWKVDVDYHGLIHKESSVEPCYFQNYFYWSWEEESSL